MDNEEKEICWSIGLFYIEKNGQDKKAAEAEITRLGIRSIRLNRDIPIPKDQQRLTEAVYGPDKVQLKKDEVEIVLNRPGLIIGKRGENVDKLTKFLQEKNNISHVRIVEDDDNVLDSLLAPCWDHGDI